MKQKKIERVKDDEVCRLNECSDRVFKKVHFWCGLNAYELVQVDDLKNFCLIKKGTFVFVGG